MKRFIVLLTTALPLLFGAVDAMAQQPLKHTEATATATTTKTPDGKTITTQTSKVVTTAPTATTTPKPAPPAAKPEPVKHEPPSESHLHKYEPLVIGMQDNLDIAKHIDDSLAIDPKGNYPLTPKLCQPNGYSCGTPAMLLQLALLSDPDKKGQLTLKNFSTFIRRLVLIQNTDPPGSHRWMGGIIRNTRTVKWDAMSRPYEVNEKVYADPDNMKPVVQTKCVNFIGDIVPEYGCAEVHFFIKEAGTEDHTGPEGKPIVVAPDDVCRPALKRPGETEFENALLDLCPRTTCEADWFSFEALVPGEYVLRLPKSVAYSDVVLDFCLLFADGTQTNATRITKTAYTKLWRAYIDYPPDFTMSKESREKIGWKGLVHTWQMSDQRAYPGPRPPSDGLPK